jgi:hypothetical protein
MDAAQSMPPARDTDAAAEDAPRQEDVGALRRVRRLQQRCSLRLRAALCWRGACAFRRCR